VVAPLLRFGPAFSCDFVDSHHGWLSMFSSHGTTAAAPDLYVTGDGGSTWSMLSAFPYVGVDLDFLTVGTGWASTAPNQFGEGASYLVETDDGGRSWKALSPRLSPPSPPS
jgi:photosystem II stability/assembly factor-like uncharacterized protein